MYLLGQLPQDFPQKDRKRLLAVLSGLGVTPEALWTDRQLRSLKTEFRRSAVADNRELLWAALPLRVDMPRLTTALTNAGVTDIQFRQAKLASDLRALRNLEA